MSDRRDVYRGEDPIHYDNRYSSEAAEQQKAEFYGELNTRDLIRDMERNPEFYGTLVDVGGREVTPLMREWVAEHRVYRRPCAWDREE